MILKFYSNQCGPCKFLTKQLEEAGLGTKTRDFNTDTEEGMEMARKYRVSGLPSLIFIKNDKEIDRCTGVTNGLEFVKKYGDEDGNT